MHNYNISAGGGTVIGGAALHSLNHSITLGSYQIPSEYTQPIQTVEKDDKKFLVYNAQGFIEETVKIEEEFINKSKEFYLNIKGEYEDDYLEIENSLDIHLQIDKNIYDSYAVGLNNGFLIITLHEILNEKPDIKRV